MAFTASMSDYTIDETTKQIVDGQRVPTTFTEFWTFIRRADSKTAVGQTGLASTCPSCGAPLQLKDGRCAFCSAPVRTSSSEWVVDQIEQVLEPVVNDPDLPALEKLRQFFARGGSWKAERKARASGWES